MTFWVDVLVPVAGDNPRGDKRLLVPRVEHRTLFGARAWLGAQRHAFRGWLAESEPEFEAWVHHSDGEPVLYERCLRDGFGPPEEVLQRSQLREMRKRPKKAATAATTANGHAPLTNSMNGHAPAHASNGQVNGKGILSEVHEKGKVT